MGDAELLGITVFVGTVVAAFAFGVLCRKYNLLGNVQSGMSYPADDSVKKELEIQTEIMKKEYNDRISGYKQNYKKWD